MNSSLDRAPLVTVEEVAKGARSGAWRWTVALDSVSLRIDAGQKVNLIGPSGSRKS